MLNKIEEIRNMKSFQQWNTPVNEIALYDEHDVSRFFREGIPVIQKARHL